MAMVIDDMANDITEWDTQTFSDACEEVNLNIYPRWHKVIHELSTLKRTFDNQNKMWISVYPNHMQISYWT